MSKSEMRSDEMVVETLRANHIQGRIMHGGRLLLTDQRLIFSPHWFDALLRGKSWECELGSISAVSKAPRGSKLFDGSLRHRLQVECGDTIDFFVVSHVDAVVATVGAATGR